MLYKWQKALKLNVYSRKLPAEEGTSSFFYLAEQRDASFPPPQLVFKTMQ